MIPPTTTITSSASSNLSCSSFSGGASVSCGLISITGLRSSSLREGRPSQRWGLGIPLSQKPTLGSPPLGRKPLAYPAALGRAQVAEREQPTGSLPRDREITAISTLVFDSCRSRCPSDLLKSA